MYGGCTGGVSGTVYGWKNNKSRIMDSKISFSRITMFSLYSVPTQREVAKKECLKKAKLNN